MDKENNFRSVLHFHFVFPRESVEDFISKATREEFEEEFYDNQDKSLMKQNIWLKKQRNGKLIAKKVVKKSNVLVYDEFRDLPQQHLEHLEIVARYKVIRYKVEGRNVAIKLDITTVEEDYIYSIGTLELSVPLEESNILHIIGKATLDPLIIRPVRSKVLEYLMITNVKLYDALLDNEVILDLPYCSIPYENVFYSLEQSVLKPKLVETKPEEIDEVEDILFKIHANDEEGRKLHVRLAYLKRKSLLDHLKDYLEFRKGFPELKFASRD